MLNSSWCRNHQHLGVQNPLSRLPQLGRCPMVTVALSQTSTLGWAHICVQWAVIWNWFTDAENGFIQYFDQEDKVIRILFSKLHHSLLYTSHYSQLWQIVAGWKRWCQPWKCESFTLAEISPLDDPVISSFCHRNSKTMNVYPYRINMSVKIQKHDICLQIYQIWGDCHIVQTTNSGKKYDCCV